eukprot:TRINITY_DN523_c0_g1_i4.p1 TRINITY_DN523_c0_g1~~TRINITY_DN523_c0_g1_i4.p1  ORF type:complete len:101 (-),score=17.91 TRINITY_DN523_c0_g1_i4:192-494(-)
MLRSLVGSEMCIRDRHRVCHLRLDQYSYPQVWVLYPSANTTPRPQLQCFYSTIPTSAQQALLIAAVGHHGSVLLGFELRDQRHVLDGAIRTVLLLSLIHI